GGDGETRSGRGRSRSPGRDGSCPDRPGGAAPAQRRKRPPRDAPLHLSLRRRARGRAHRPGSPGRRVLSLVARTPPPPRSAPDPAPSAPSCAAAARGPCPVLDGARRVRRFFAGRSRVPEGSGDGALQHVERLARAARPGEVPGPLTTRGDPRFAI